MSAKPPIRRLLHPWLQCPDYVSPEAKERFEQRLQELRRRRIEAAPMMNWTLAQNVGLNTLLEPLFVQESVQDSFVEFECRGFSKVFHVNKPVYRELVLEFLNAFQLDKIQMA
ncbi:hypothetical protein L2E82_36072 [Cichorium intybus]|uniref:Uncharacterized protein n=1 Tax=Cichorium intybus TaxID=13427 RepID=A0ACB9BQR4_CICIN|nr:hypothetical protein L2E82_36072 [Cichorium intybus]